jgi:TolB-like protein
MKKTLFYILAMFTGMGVFAQQPVVAVAPFDAISGISSTEANMITRVFFIRLGNTNKVSLVDRGVVERVLKEHSFQAGDWSNQQKTAELGTALNADWIVRGEMEKFGNNILVTVQFYDIRTFRFMGGSDLRLANADEAYDKMDPLVDKLVQTIASSGAQPKQQGGNTGASAYYGTWLTRSSNSNDTMTLIVEANKITARASNGNYFIIVNCTWTVENNIMANTLTDYPKGFKISGTVTEINGSGWNANYLMPVYLFIHKSDNNKMEFSCSPNSTSEMQNGRFYISAPYGKIQ